VKTDAWMPLWIGSYLADTQHLSRDEHGGYLLLLMTYWRVGGPLPDDDKRLAAIVKATPKEWKALRPVLAEFFTVADGVWVSKRAEQELADSLVRKEKAASKAQAAAQARWGKSPSKPPSNARGNAPSTPQAMHEQCPTPSPLNTSDADASGGEPPAPPPPAPVPPPAPAHPKDIVFGLGVPMLTAAGVAEKLARSFLAMNAKHHGDAALADALNRCATERAVDPISWIQRALGPIKPGAARGSKHAGFLSKNYQDGVTEDGFLA
jgi:uncharacterized protein YdaU (DUF1376 family)